MSSFVRNRSFTRFSSNEINAIIAVGDPIIKENIFNKIDKNIPNCKYPNLIYPDVIYDTRFSKIRMGKGVIICSNNILTTDTLGNFICFKS